MIPGLLKRLKFRTLLWKGEWEGGVMAPSPPPPYFPADPWIFMIETKTEFNPLGSVFLQFYNWSFTLHCNQYNILS